MTDLLEGQYELGSVVFGRCTPISVESCEVAPYSTSASEYQMNNTDENRYGQDFIQPGSLTFSMSVLDNRILPNMISPTKLDTLPSIIPGGKILEELNREWRADDIRLSWGKLSILRKCVEGKTVRIYGRPRKFASSSKSMKSEWYNVTAEFSRVDTYAYSDEEAAVDVVPSAAGTTTKTIVRGDGQASAWLRVLIQGPVTNPKVKIGNFLIEISTTLAAGKVLEISSYPWERRVVDSDAVNLSAQMIGNSPYLSDLRIPANATLGVGLSGTGTTAATKAFVLWREAYHTF